MAMIGGQDDLTTTSPASRAGERLRLRSRGWFGAVLRLAAAGAILGSVAFLAGLVYFVSRIAPSEPAGVPRTDAIVVVTGGSQRVGDAIGLLGADRGARLLISGVNERTGRDEIARINPASRELLTCCVDLDYRARNTIGNAIEARRWARQHDFRSLLVVTSNYHMPRVMAEFQHAMPQMRLIAHPVVADHPEPTGWWQRSSALRIIVPEYAKYLVARLLRALFETDPETSRLSVIIGGRKPVNPKPADTLGPDSEKRSRLAHPRHEA